MSDHKGARLILDALPPASFLPTVVMIAIGSGMLSPKEAASPAYPPPKAGKSRCPMTRRSISSATKSRNMFARLKDWRRIATRYDRCAHTFFSSGRGDRLVSEFLRYHEMLVSRSAESDCPFALSALISSTIRLLNSRRSQSRNKRSDVGG